MTSLRRRYIFLTALVTGMYVIHSGVGHAPSFLMTLQTEILSTETSNFLKQIIFSIIKFSFSAVNENFVVALFCPQTFSKAMPAGNLLKVGCCFGFYGPLKQYFSLYHAVSKNEGGRKKKR